VDITLDIPGSTDKLLLIDPDGDQRERAKPFQNILRVNQAGETIWTVSRLENPYDCFVNLRWHQGLLLANSWSCFLFEVDPETGILVDCKFVK
jgi:hypothetical protein